jgi:hypothetical protein
MEFNANSSFYKFNEQWGWFGWSDGPFLGDSLNYQEDLKIKHRNSETNPEILTPYYNVGFNGVQPYIDPMAAARDGDKGYLLYGDFNAKNYLRRFSLHVKSLNYAQWERDPREGRTVEQHSDVYAFNTVGTKKRNLTNHAEDPFARLDSWPNTEITLLDLNTQDLYYKEGSSPDGNTEDEWNAFGIGTWDPWPASNRTYGFGQYGFSEVEVEGVQKLKRYASPVKGAPARIRRIPLYYRANPIRFDGLWSIGPKLSGAEMGFVGDDVPVIEQFYDPENGDITFEIPDTSYKHYEEKYGIELDYGVLVRMSEMFRKPSGECPDLCDNANPQPYWQTGYYYTLSTAPVMCPPPNKLSLGSGGGLGADPRGGKTSEWAPGGGYGIVVEKMGENNCPPNIQDVDTKTFHGSTTIKGQGSCKTIELDMGLYQVLGNTNSSSLYQKNNTGEYEEYLPVIDVAASNLWIGAVNEEEDCEFYQHGEVDKSCTFMNRMYPDGKLSPLTYDTDEAHKDGWAKYTYGANIESFIELYKHAKSGSFDFGCIINKWKDEFGNDIYSKAESSKALQPIEEKGAVQLNLRQITGIGCIEVFKGEDVFSGCEQRNYLYISGGGGDLKVNWETAGTGMGTGYGLLETGEGMISGSSNLVKGYYRVTGSETCPTNFLELYSIAGTGCLSTYESGNTIYISGGCGPSITGDGSIFTYYDESGVLHISGKAGESKNITGTGCITTYEIDDTIYIDSDVPNLKVNWETAMGTGTGMGTGYGLLETGEGTISGSSNLIKGYYNITGSGACPTNFLEFYSITGTGCIDTFIEDNKIYISGGKGVTGATSPNIDPLDNIANVYSGIRTGECGDELVFKSLSGTGCIQIFDRGHYIEIENKQQFFANDSNLWHTGGGIYEEACYFNFELKDITGAGCISTYAEGNTIYISGENCLPEGGSSCDVLVGPSDNPSWKDSESLILECLGVSWKTITMCEEDGSTSCYDILVRPCSASTTTPSP